MAQPAPQPPSLPDQIEGVNLFQYVSNAAALEPDPAIWSQMDIRVLFALGTAAWVKTEIHVRIMKHPDPATMLSTLPPAAEIGRVARIARAYYMPVNTIQANATFSDTEAIVALLAYWGLYSLQNHDAEDVLYDWLSEVIDWETGKQVFAFLSIHLY